MKGVHRPRENGLSYALKIKLTKMDPRMTDAQPAAPALEALRRELDEIDDAMIALLSRRVGITQDVKSLKLVTSKALVSPLRPAREAQIHRRILLLAKAKGIEPDLALRLWRNILTQSSLSQAPITLHVSKRLSQTMGHRLRVRDHFPAMPVEEWKDEAQALMQVNVNPGDICVVETTSPWVEAYVAGKAGQAHIIGTLPVLREGAMPELLLIGTTAFEASGTDETLLITRGSLPRDFPVPALWQVKAGSFRLTALAGSYAEHESPLVGLSRSNISLGLKVAGRYPSAIEG
jgi:chorismate mutase